MSSFSRTFLERFVEATSRIDAPVVERIATGLAAVRDNGGRLFVLGVGGSAANASHAVNDFRKIAHLETYSPSDNVSELTARTNDDGWAVAYREWLRVSRLSGRDALLVFSVGGGDLERNISPTLVLALEFARECGASIYGIVGRDGGHTARVAEACVLVPTVDPALTTPIAEAMQGVIWHALVSHPALKRSETTWEAKAPEHP